MRIDKDLIVKMCLVVSASLLLLTTGTLNSGYHFVDDHEVIKIKDDLTTSSVIDVSVKWIRQDIGTNMRFRPLYYAHRVLETKFFGSDFLLWSIYNLFLFCIASLTFYSALRRMKFGIPETLVFLVVVYIGHQSGVWWRLGPGEGLGMVFTGIAFYFISKTGHTRYNLLNNILFCISLILASLTKESFIIIIPAMVIFKFYYDYKILNDSQRLAICNNQILIIPIIICISEIYFIKKFVGTSYAGIDSNLVVIISGVLMTILKFIRTYLALLITFSVIIAINWFHNRALPKLNMPSFIFACLIIVPNAILYFRTGLTERYLLPSSLGLAYIVLSFIKELDDNPQWLRKTVALVFIISFIPSFINVLRDAKDFSTDGRDTRNLFEEISEYYIPENQVLLIVDPVDSYEISVSLKIYLFYECKIDLYGYGLVKENEIPDNQPFIDGWKYYFTNCQFENQKMKPGLLIFLDKRISDRFFEKSVLHIQDYFKIDLGISKYALFRLKTAIQ
jgi:hypothetical protein